MSDTAEMQPHRRHGPVSALRSVVTRPKVGLLVVLVVIAAGVGLSMWRSYRTLEAEQKTEETTRALTQVADPVARLCADDPTVRARLGDEVCFQAQRAAAAAGRDGKDGMDGRGIVATVIGSDGHLVVSYTDGARVDVGRVAGQPGIPGRGIVSARIDTGQLQLVFSDGIVQDLGQVVGERGLSGADGRGITSTDIVDGRLVVTYSDGTNQDAGPVPSGPQGPQGPPGEPPSSYTNHYPDGTSQTCTRAGGKDSAPVYNCTERT